MASNISHLCFGIQCGAAETYNFPLVILRTYYNLIFIIKCYLIILP